MNHAPAAHLVSGQRAEDEACRYLEQRGLRCIGRNYRCAAGEIDLLLTEGRTLVFAEVRYRRNSNYGGAVESVGARKRGRLIAAASHYLQAHPAAARQACRFDVIAVSGDRGDEITWIADAFRPE